MELSVEEKFLLLPMKKKKELGGRWGCGKNK